MDGFRVAIKDARERIGEGLQLSRTQLEILLMLHESARTTSELAKSLALTQGAITQTIDTLVRRTLVERYPDESDRRIVRLRISTAGQELTTKLGEFRQAKMHALYGRLSSEETQSLVSIARKMTELIEDPTLKKINKDKE